MTKKLFNYLEKNGFGIRECDNEYYIYIDNACGEDFSLTITKSNTQQEIEDIINECESFDVDEHFSLWFGANRGEPTSARRLLENCEEIGEELERLEEVLRNYKK